MSELWPVRIAVEGVLVDNVAQRRLSHSIRGVGSFHVDRLVGRTSRTGEILKNGEYLENRCEGDWIFKIKGSLVKESSPNDLC